MNTLSKTGLFLGLVASVVILSGVTAVGAESFKAELVEARKIWDRAPHNAFTDLIRFKEKWFCVFREGKGHVSADGALRIITSTNGQDWVSAALLTSTNSDLRDAKIVITPSDELMLCGAGALHPPAAFRHQSLAWFSKDGTTWSKSVKIGEPDQWLWRVTWHKEKAYGVGYDTKGEKFVRLYESMDGRFFSPLVARLHDQENPNESSIVFVGDKALCLLRRDGTPGHGLLGESQPPYQDWRWRDLGFKIGGPHMIRLPDGRLIAGVRLYDGRARTALLAVNAETGTAKEILTLPSGGDTSYPGLVWHDGLLWVSYYSSHEGKTSIYLAKVKLQ